MLLRPWGILGIILVSPTQGEKRTLLTTAIILIAVGLSGGLFYIVTRYMSLRTEFEQISSEVDALTRQKAELLQGLER